MNKLLIALIAGTFAATVGAQGTMPGETPKDKSKQKHGAIRDAGRHRDRREARRSNKRASPKRRRRSTTPKALPTKQDKQKAVTPPPRRARRPPATGRRKKRALPKRRPRSTIRRRCRPSRTSRRPSTLDQGEREPSKALRSTGKAGAASPLPFLFARAQGVASGICFSSANDARTRGSSSGGDRCRPRGTRRALSRGRRGNRRPESASTSPRGISRQARRCPRRRRGKRSKKPAIAVVPAALVGIYRWQASGAGSTYLRFAFAVDVLDHEPGRALDAGIVRVRWLSYDDLVDSRARHRSPLVLRCVDDYRAGLRRPLDLVAEVA